MADLPPIPPDLVAELEDLTDTVAQRPDHADVAAKLEWLIDALIMRGQLPTTYRRLSTKIKSSQRSTVRLAMIEDKYDTYSPDIDCASRIPLCGARCCSLEVTLSAQDIHEQVPFDVLQPYSLPRHPETKRCVCMDDTGGCTIYERRPSSCRSYDCRVDPRVWIDFDARIPAPMPESIQPTRSEP